MGLLGIKMIITNQALRALLIIYHSNSCQHVYSHLCPEMDAISCTPNFDIQHEES